MKTDDLPLTPWRQNYPCQAGLGGCAHPAVKRIRYDTNPYENDKYMWVCEAHLELEE